MKNKSKNKKTTSNKAKNIFEILIKLFKNGDNTPLLFTDTQKEIMWSIFFQENNRVGVITPTQYGKSTATACGIILRTIVFNNEKFAVIGGTEKKKYIIGRYILQHLFDHDLFISRLDFDKSGIERLKKEMKKDYIQLKNGSVIQLLSADYKNQKRLGEILLGEGAKNIVIDDSVLCDDKLYAYIKRMLGGEKENFLIELSNPLKRNHFFKLMNHRSTQKIWIDYSVALKEGRFTEEFIEEMRREPFFEIFYGCKFPEDDLIDEKGFLQLFTVSDIQNAFMQDSVDLDFQNGKLGVDIGRGHCKTVLCLRKNNVAKILFAAPIKDLMAAVGLIIETIKKYNLNCKNVFIDDTGVGSGVSDRLREQKYYISPVVWGQKSKNKKFSNIKAESFYNLKEWMQKGGKIVFDDKLSEQFSLIKYKFDSSGCLILQSKDEIILQGNDSPDELDALALTFTPEVAFESADIEAVIDSFIKDNEFSFLR